MKTYNIIVLAALAALCFASCNETDSSPYGKKTGTLCVAVSEDTPEVKSINQVTDFPVDITTAAGVSVSHYETVAEVPSSIILDVGKYNVSSHTPGAIRRRMDEPYYGGSKEVEIIAGNTTIADVICTMQNTKIAVVYGGDFFDVFKTWVITIDDGTDTALSFSDEDNIKNNQTSCFWQFINQTEGVTLNFTGYTKEGNSRITQKFTIRKSQAETGYDNDKAYFTGGDALVFTFTPEEATSGKIGSVTLDVKIEFTETEESITLDVEDVPTYEPGEDDPVGPDNPPAEKYIKLTLPEPMTIDAGTDPSLGDVKIEAEKGIKTLIVKVESTSEEMIDALNGVYAEYPKVNLVGGCEVVENQGLVDFLGSLGKEITVPSQGDKNYTFPVGQFFGFLSLLPGEHTFKMTVADMAGNEESGTIVLTVEE